MRNIQQVPYHAASRALRARARPAHGEGNIRVAARAEVENVLRTAYGSEWALHGRILQSDRDGPMLRDTDQVAEHVVFFDCEKACGETLVVFREPLHEFRQRDVFEAFRDQRLVWYLVWFDLPSHHARQDDGFAVHVEPREVVPRVGLGVVEIHRLPYRFGEGSAALDRAHDEAQSAARACQYLQNLIPRLQQAAYGRDYGHACPYRGLVPETVRDHAHELAVLGRAARERSFVGEHEISPAPYTEQIQVEGTAVHGHIDDYPCEAWLGLRAEHAFQRLDAKLGEGATFLLEAYRLRKQLLAEERARGIRDGAVPHLDTVALQPAFALFQDDLGDRPADVPQADLDYLQPPHATSSPAKSPAGGIRHACSARSASRPTSADTRNTSPAAAMPKCCTGMPASRRQRRPRTRSSSSGEPMQTTIAALPSRPSVHGISIATFCLSARQRTPAPGSKPVTCVPAPSGANVLRTKTSMPASEAGSIVLG